MISVLVLKQIYLNVLFSFKVIDAMTYCQFLKSYSDLICLFESILERITRLMLTLLSTILYTKTLILSFINLKLLNEFLKHDLT